MALKLQPGNELTWVNGTGSAVVSGQVVKFGTRILAVAAVDIANGASGTVHLVGVFKVPKVTGAVWAAGEVLSWDASAANFDDASAVPAAGDLAGSVIAIAAGTNGQVTAEVKFLGIPGTLT